MVGLGGEGASPPKLTPGVESSHELKPQARTRSIPTVSRACEAVGFPARLR